MILRRALSVALSVALVAPLVAALPGLAQASMPDVSCDDRARLHQTLEDRLGAERTGMGLRDPETMLEVWVNPQSGDWLIVQNYANGTACIVAMGDHWQGLSAKKPA